MTDRRITVHAKESSSGWSAALEVALNDSGESLLQRIAAMIGTPAASLKILAAGKFIKPGPSLESQGIKDSTKLLVLRSASAEQQQQIKTEEESSARIARILSAAEAMAGRVAGGSSNRQRHFFELQDQNGRAVELPRDQRSALVLGMTLHEKGRAALKAQDLKLALELFLHSDKCFSTCPPQLLQAVDNYAYLCLDIVWTYFKLKDLSNLSDASRWLAKAEEGFVRSHGPSLERLLALKGFCTELAAYVRLHLLQGVLAFHSTDYAKAQRLLQQAQAELRSLQISDEHIAILSSMGFTFSEARRGLRACGNNPTKAADYIIEERQKRAKVREEEQARRQKKKDQRRLGKTTGGDQVDMAQYESLCSMGFPPELVAEALRQCNNSQEGALNALVQNFEGLQSAVFSRAAETEEKQSKKNRESVDPDKLKQLVSMGFEPDAAHAALLEANGSIEDACQLLDCGLVTAPAQNPPSSSGAPSGEQADAHSGEGSDASSGGRSKELAEITESLRRMQEEEDRKIEEEIVTGFESDEQHLDLDLREEQSALDEYTVLLSQLA